MLDIFEESCICNLESVKITYNCAMCYVPYVLCQNSVEVEYTNKNIKSICPIHKDIEIYFCGNPHKIYCNECTQKRFSICDSIGDGITYCFFNNEEFLKMSNKKIIKTNPDLIAQFYELK